MNWWAHTRCSNRQMLQRWKHLAYLYTSVHIQLSRLLWGSQQWQTSWEGSDFWNPSWASLHSLAKLSGTHWSTARSILSFIPKARWGSTGALQGSLPLVPRLPSPVATQWPMVVGQKDGKGAWADKVLRAPKAGHLQTPGRPSLPRALQDNISHSAAVLGAKLSDLYLKATKSVTTNEI